jgi:hypothetical protein
VLTKIYKISYKLKLQNGIYNLVGQMLKRDIVAIYRNQNISKTTIYRIIRECEEDLPYMNLHKTGRSGVLNHPRLQNLIESAKSIKRVSTGRLG